MFHLFAGIFSAQHIDSMLRTGESRTRCMSDLLVVSGLCVKTKQNRACPIQPYLFLSWCASSQARVVCAAQKARPFPFEKYQEKDINLPGSRWDVTENGDLKGREASSSGEESKHQSKENVFWVLSDA